MKVFNAKISEPFLHIRARYHSPTTGRSSSFKSTTKSGSGRPTIPRRGCSHSHNASPQLPRKKQQNSAITSSRESLASNDSRTHSKTSQIIQSFVTRDKSEKTSGPNSANNSSKESLVSNDGLTDKDLSISSATLGATSSKHQSSNESLGISNDALEPSTNGLEDNSTENLGTSDMSIPGMEYSEGVSSSLDTMVSSCPSLSYLLSSIEIMTTETQKIPNLSTNDHNNQPQEDASQPSSSSTKGDTVIMNDDSLAYLGNPPFDLSPNEISDL